MRSVLVICCDVYLNIRRMIAHEGGCFTAAQNTCGGISLKIAPAAVDRRRANRIAGVTFGCRYNPTGLRIHINCDLRRNLWASAVSGADLGYRQNTGSLRFGVVY